MPKGYHHLTYAQRSQIAILKDRGDSANKIAKALKVHHTTITREISRNSENSTYQQEKAQAKSELRRSSPSRAKKKMKPDVVAQIKQKLELQWSPVQISGFLKKRAIAEISHETIYTYIWKDKQQGGLLYKHLRHHGKKYNKRGHKLAGRGCIIARIDIDQRPQIVEEKSRLGDWELDTIIGAQGEDVLVSMVERASKLTRLVKVNRKTSASAQDLSITQASGERMNEIRDILRRAQIRPENAPRQDTRTRPGVTDISLEFIQEDPVAVLETLSEEYLSRYTIPSLAHSLKKIFLD